MFTLTIGGAALAALLIGYFLNIYVVIAIVVILCGYFVYEVKRPNTMPGTSGKMGGIFISIVVLAPFVLIALITTFIVNFALVMSLFGTIAHYAAQLFLR